MLSGEATNTNFIVFDLTQPGLEPMIYHIQGEHAYYYTTDTVTKQHTACVSIWFSFNNRTLLSCHGCQNHRTWISSSMTGANWTAVLTKTTKPTTLADFWQPLQEGCYRIPLRLISCIIMWTQRCLQYRCHMVFWTHEKSTPGSIYHIVFWMKIDPGVNIPWGSKYHMTPGMSLVPTADTQGI